jgi:putative endonuclease
MIKGHVNPTKEQFAQNIGNSGELLASKFLIGKGYTILQRNFRMKFGELDIIARSKDGVLVFVEVKTLHEGALAPEDNMSQAKRRKLFKTCEFFAREYPGLIREKLGWRVDVVAITMSRTGENYSVNHYQNIA